MRPSGVDVGRLGASATGCSRPSLLLSRFTDFGMRCVPSQVDGTASEQGIAQHLYALFMPWL